MYDKIKNFIRDRYILILICIVVIIACGIWLYSDSTSDIDTTGVRNAEQQLERAGEYNQQSIDYNQRARTTIESSQTLNERTEARISTSIDLNTRTENAIDTSTELVARAREDAERAKVIVSESRSILERAEERNQKSEIATTKQ